MKKEYKKPQLSVMHMQTQQLVCYSGGFNARENNAEQEELWY